MTPIHSFSASTGKAWLATLFIPVLVLGCVNNSIPPNHAGGGCLPEQGRPSCFYKQTASTTKLIIFVHGLFGSTADTWGDPRKNTFWPEMVKNDSTYRDSDIYLINYRSPFVDGAPNIYETGEIELAMMKSRKVFDQYQEIYFISHSMGGVVVRSILTQLNESQDRSHLRQIKGVVYLATPAQGSGLAGFLARVSPNPQLKNLEPSHLNAYLQNLEDRWKQLIDDRDMAKAAFPRVFCAYETQVTGGLLIVPREFAYSRCDSRLHPLPFDHFEMAKPTAYNQDPYLWVMAQIRESGAGVAQDEITDRTILIECHYDLMPKLVPPEGRIYVLAPHALAQENGGGGLVEYFAPPGSEWTWSSKGHLAEAYRCQLTNYGSASVFNVAMAFPMIFKELIRDDENPNVTRTGLVTLSREWPIEVTKIDVGPNGFVFYVHNTTQQFLQVFLAQSATLQLARDNKRRTVRLIQPSLSGFQMHLGPMHRGK